MHLLQIGVAKSGNLWLYNILEQIYRHADIPRKSHIQSHPIYPIAKQWPLSYPRQADIDMLDIGTRQCYWRISTIFRMPVEQVKKYVADTSHVWTHSRISKKSFEVYPLFDKKIYIIRDPRDRAFSEAKFAFSEYIQRFSPPEEDSFEEYLDMNLEGMMNRWRWHVYDHLRYAGELNIYPLFYERLLENFPDELNRLLDYLGVSLSRKEKEAISEATDFSSMKKGNPDHLRKGTSGEWKRHFSAAQTERSEAIIGPLLDLLNYRSGLPAVTEPMDKQFWEARLNEIGSHPYIHN